MDEEAEVSERRVMAVSYGPGNPATTFVMLDPSGNLVDYLHSTQFRCVLVRACSAPPGVHSGATLSALLLQRCHPSPQGRARRSVLCV